MGLVNGRGRFSTQHSSETPQPIFMKLEIYNYLPDTTPRAKCLGATLTWVVSGNSQFDAWKFLSFFSFLRNGHGSLFWTHPHAQYVIIRRSRYCRQGSAFLALEIWKLKFDPFYLQKYVKNGTLSWRSMENCNPHNSGTISRIHLTVGTGIEHRSGITWHESKVKRSKVKVTRSRNVIR